MPWTSRIFVILNVTVVSVFCLTAEQIEAEKSGWSATPNTQYHIQTDEGPERYFRFQTLNGQYRKEKRLEDGTVIGTEGWLDPLGYLRIKDYIADREGFRILKSKMVFVGKDRPIEDAVAASERVPAQSGVLARPRRPPNPFRQPALQVVSGNSIESSTTKPYRLYSPVTRRYQVPTTTASPRTNYYSSTIDPRPILPENDYSKPATNYLPPSYKFQSPYKSPYRSPYPFVAKPALVMEPPIFVETPAQPNQPLEVQINPESTYGLYRHDRRSAPNSVAPIAPANSYNSTGRRQYRGSSTYRVTGEQSNVSSSRQRNGAYSSPSSSRNGANSSPSSSRNGAYSSPSSSRNGGASDRRRSPPNASDRSDVTSSRGTSGRQTDEYDFPPYDGHHTTADGFQYYLNTHYHEEEKNQNGDKSIGSFGYVDPFGIRRVVYYKSDPQNGFVHKKNNRYVGFNSTPYDPLPINSQ